MDLIAIYEKSARIVSQNDFSLKVLIILLIYPLLNFQTEEGSHFSISALMNSSTSKNLT